MLEKSGGGAIINPTPPSIKWFSLDFKVKNDILLKAGSSYYLKDGKDLDLYGGLSGKQVGLLKSNYNANDIVGAFYYESNFFNINCFKDSNLMSSYNISGTFYYLPVS